MSNESGATTDDEHIAFPDRDYQALAERATDAGRSWALRRWGSRPNRPWVAFDLNFPSGNIERTVSLLQLEDVQEMLAQPFEQFRLSATYQAMIDTRSGEVEVGLSTGGLRRRGYNRPSVWDLPGVEVSDDSPLKSATEPIRYDAPSGWRLAVEDDDVRIELSPKTPIFGVSFPLGMDVTLKIKHSRGPKGPRADVLLEEYATHFLLDLELQYGLGVTMQKWPGAVSKRLEATASEKEPRFPLVRYSPEASAFYWYGTSAAGLPLLQYLAYYQVLEFFFSTFTRRAVVDRLRSRLKDPRFDMRSDTDIGTLIDASRTAHAGLKNEQDQLRHTLTDCVTADAIRDFVRSDDQLSLHFLSPKGKVRGTHPVRLDAEDDDLIRQVAERVYRVRNRIVHTKAGAEEIGLDLLLPSSEESDHLWPEVELVKWLAQRALVHGAIPR